MMDIDHFKLVNDTYGHIWGDCVLKEMATLFKNNTRNTDILVRWGGEEFLCLLVDTDVSGALVTAEKYRSLIEASTIKELEEVTISLGVSTVLESDANISDSINRADLALYEAKNAGRNKVCVHDEKQE